MKKIAIVAGARPNFMKIAPIISAIKSYNEKHGSRLEYVLIHTGQHYDDKMSRDFFVQLNIPTPDINLEAGGGTQAEQTAAIMVKTEKYLLENRPDVLIVVGDVTSTLACTIVAKKLGIKVAHVEGGIRSGDMSMPEEINRLVTDSIADYFFTTSKTANDHLIREGKNTNQIFFVGNTMIDTLLVNQSRFTKPSFWDEFSLSNKKYIVVTLHRPSNVDDADQLKQIFQVIESSSNGFPVVFPVHPRTRKNMEKFGLSLKSVHLTDPLGYLEFNYLVQNALAVVTDSGGITEETTVMGIPCLTLRSSTERPETCTVGTNELLGINPESIRPALSKVLQGEWKKGAIPELWDGLTSQRIVNTLVEII